MSVVTATILSQGTIMHPVRELLSIDIQREVGRISSARLTLIDGDATTREFPLSDSDFFAPGREIEIRLRYEGDSGGDHSVFKGRVVRHGIEFSLTESQLTVELRDAAVAMTCGLRSRVFRNQSDADVFRALIASTPGLTAGKLDSTQPIHPELVQYQCTDWDFLRSRADTTGGQVLVEDGEVSVRALETGGGAVHQFEPGIDEVYEFEFEADGGSQVPGVSGMSWNIATQQPNRSAPAELVPIAQGSSEGVEIARDLQFSEDSLVHPVALHPLELQGGVNARMSRSRQSLLRGRISVPGFAPVRLLDTLKLKGTGRRFNGTTVVTGLRHRVTQEGWRTDLQFGISPTSFSQRTDIGERPAAGLLPPVSGLQIGVVDTFAADPEGQLRVRIRLPALGPDSGPLWARLASPEAGAKRGFYFRPESGDEVIVGFFNQDPRQPVILGGMFSAKNLPPPSFGPVGPDNPTKGIATKGGHVLVFEDGPSSSLTILTHGSQSLVLDDTEGSIQVSNDSGHFILVQKSGIQISDASGNTISLGAAGIEIKSVGNLTLEAGGAVTIKGATVDVQ